MKQKVIADAAQVLESKLQDEHLFILGSKKNIKNYESCLKDTGVDLKRNCLPVANMGQFEHQSTKTTT